MLYEVITIDLMSGQYMINPLEPKSWDDGSSAQDKDAPMTFRHVITSYSIHYTKLYEYTEISLVLGIAIHYILW